MGRIQVLSRHLVNKIAAGEVIERPASVVKELVENAIDAGATAVDIALSDGGKRSIAVRDNGSGMGADDLGLAFIPHATSKIACEDDLALIHTMGFRGEALSSVAAVAHAHILTRQQGSADAAGYEIRADGESVSEVRPAAAVAGTAITMNDLFFNTPARRKFLRTTETEFGHVVEQLARLALPRCDVAFTLTHNGRCGYRLGAGPLRKRVSELFGPELAEGLIELDSREGENRVTGLAALPDRARASGRWQYFFVNGRYVRDRIFTHALREAYRGMIDPARSPVAFVFVQMPPEQVDVNVHPTKIEVRFRNGQMLHSQLLGTIREALRRAAPASLTALPAGAGGAANEPADEDARRRSLKQALADFFKSNPPPQRGAVAPEYAPSQAQPSEAGTGPRGLGTQAGRLCHPLPADAPSADAPSADPARAAERAERFASYDATAAPPLVLAGERVQKPLFGDTGVAPAISSGTGVSPVAALGQYVPVERPDGGVDAGPLGALGVLQIHQSYIVAATPEGLAIIDQHALHERIIFEELRRRLAEGKLASQRLLIPVVLPVTQGDKAVLAGHAALLDRLGLELTEFGPGTVALQRFPALLAGRKVVPEEFLGDLLDLLADADARDSLSGSPNGPLPAPAEPSPSHGEGEEPAGPTAGTTVSLDHDAAGIVGRVLATMACKAAIKAGDPLTEPEMRALLARRTELDPQATCPHGRPTALVLSLDDLQRQFRRT